MEINKLFILGKKMVKAAMQLQHLRKSKEEGVVPKGIASQVKFTPSIHDDELKQECEKIMHYTASRLLDHMITYYEIRARTLNASYYSEKDKVIRATTENNERERIEKVLTEVLRKEKEETRKIHEKKMSKCRQEYKIYVQQEQPTLQTGNNNNNQIDENNETNNRKRRQKKKKRKPKRVLRREEIKGNVPSIDEITEERMKDTVINLTDLQLTKPQLYIFYLSQSFAPTPKLPNLTVFEKDLQNWINRLRWRYYYGNKKNATNTNQQPNETDEQVNNMERTLIKKTDVHNAPKATSHALELFIERVTKDAHDYKPNRNRTIPDNLPQEARKALKELKNLHKNKDIIIRPFDKGVGFFLIKKEEYIQRTLQALSDTETYETVDLKEAAEKTTEEVKQWTIQYQNEKGMTEKITKWVTPDVESQNPGNIYLNLKAHKPPAYPGRLITTGCNSYIENLSALTAHELKKVDLEYRLMDTPHFLRKIDELNESGLLLNKDIIHVSVDVVNMFPNIPKEFGMQECKKHLDRRENKIFSTDCILKAIEICLENNIGNFNDVTYRQKKGTAMGPKNACDYADVAMNYIDQAVQGKNPSCPSFRIKPIFWGRFRDDIYMPWVGTLEELMEFIEWLNSIHPSLKFTVTYSRDGVEYLDLFIYSINGKIHTKLYSKSSDTHSYLVPTSCHKYHIIHNIPYNIARRVLQNNSEEDNYTADKTKYTKYLTDRGYNEKMVSDSFKKAEEIDRRQLYAKKTESNNKTCTPLVIDDNPTLPPMTKIINNNKNVLSLDPQLTEIVPKDSIFVSYRAPKNIKDLLISSKLRNNDRQPEQSIENGCFKCNNCYLCRHYLQETKTFTSYHTNQVFDIRQHITCNTKNVIYLIECLQHQVSNVGYTTNNMKMRFSNNKSHIKKKKLSCEICSHMITENHEIDFRTNSTYDESFSKLVKVTVIEAVQGIGEGETTKAKEEKCEKREAFWQRQLKTLTTYGGLNIRDGARHYLGTRS